MQTFNQFAAKQIQINEDSNGLFALVPDQSGSWMRVTCVESKSSVHASHCSCSTFSKKQHCNHIVLVQNYWNRLYPQKVEETPVVETPVKVRKPRNGLVRKTRNGGLVKVEQKPVAKIIELPVQPSKVTDISTRGNLSSNQGFRLMR